MSVICETGSKVELFSLWKSRRVVVAFTRHMGCRFCKEQVSLLQKLKTFLVKEDVQTIVVTIGNFEDIPKFREETSFEGEIYVDSNLERAECFEVLNLARGEDVLFVEGTDPKEIRPETVNAAKRVVFSDGGYGTAGNLYTGDVLQIGGVFVLGPGNTCDFSHRSTFVGDLPDMDALCVAVSGKLSNNTYLTYPGTERWNQQLQVTEPRYVASEASVQSVCPMPLLMVFILAVLATCMWAITFLDPIPETRFLKMTVMTIFSTSIIWMFIRKNKLDYDIIKSSNLIDDIELFTMSQVDAMVVSNGLQTCECEFMKSINMTSLRSHTRGRDRAMSIEDEPICAGSEDELAKAQVLERMQCYVREFLAKPNPNLGRKGPTCPFVPLALKHDLVHLAWVPRQLSTSLDSIHGVVLSMLERYKALEPTTGVRQQYKTIIMVFPFVPLVDAPDLIDSLQKKLKPQFVDEGLMLGEFHKTNNASGLHNPNFFPLRTPHPCLAIRTMVPSDIVFLNDKDVSREGRKAMITKFLEKFGDTTAHDSQSKIAMEMLKGL